MDKQLLARLEHEAGFEAGTVWIFEAGVPSPDSPKECSAMLAHFAALVAEECAKLCGGIAPTAYSDAPEAWCAERIRAKFA